MTKARFERPFPALTPAQRYHLDVYGYLVVEKTLGEDEVDRLLEAMDRLRNELLAAPDPSKAVVRHCRLSTYSKHRLHFAHILETDPAIFGYLTHPRLVGMAEELIGGDARLEESEAVINSRNAEEDRSMPPRYGFHVGTWPGLAGC